MAAQYMLEQEKHPSEETQNLHTFTAFAVHCLHKLETEVEMIRIIITKKWREEGSVSYNSDIIITLMS